MDATVSEGSSDHRTLGTLTRFLLLHALILVAFHLAMGWLWFQVYRQNEFSGLALVKSFRGISRDFLEFGIIYLKPTISSKPGFMKKD